MNKIKTISSAALLCSALVFAACNNHNQETPEENITNSTTVSDSSYQSSRDSVSKGTTVTPSSSFTTPNP